MVDMTIGLRDVLAKLRLFCYLPAVAEAFQSIRGIAASGRLRFSLVANVLDTRRIGIADIVRTLVFHRRKTPFLCRRSMSTARIAVPRKWQPGLAEIEEAVAAKVVPPGRTARPDREIVDCLAMIRFRGDCNRQFLF